MWDWFNQHLHLRVFYAGVDSKGTYIPPELCKNAGIFSGLRGGG